MPRLSACSGATAELRPRPPAKWRQCTQRSWHRECGHPKPERLIGGIELTPDEVRHAISDCCDAIYVNADFHSRSAWRCNAAILGQFAVRRYLPANLLNHAYRNCEDKCMVRGETFSREEGSAVQRQGLESLRSGRTPCLSNHAQSEPSREGRDWPVISAIQKLSHRHP
jgi:hypothetical protein